MSATAYIDERGLAWFFVRIAGSRGSAIYHGCIDTGATYCVLSEHNCTNLGLTRHPDKLKVSLITVKGDTSAKIFIAPSMAIEGKKLKAINVEIAAKKVPGFPLILGMSFLSQFNWSFNKRRKEFTILKDCMQKIEIEKMQNTKVNRKNYWKPLDTLS